LSNLIVHLITYLLISYLRRSPDLLAGFRGRAPLERDGERGGKGKGKGGEGKGKGDLLMGSRGDRRPWVSHTNTTRAAAAAVARQMLA